MLVTPAELGSALKIRFEGNLLSDGDQLILDSVEAMVRQHCGCNFSKTEHSREEHEVKLPRRYGGFVLDSSRSFLLNDSPVISLTKIESVIRMTDQGTFQYENLPLSNFFLNRVMGRISYSLGSLKDENEIAPFVRDNLMVLAVTYEAGYEEIPPDVKNAVIFEFGRFRNLFKTERFQETSSSGKLGSKALVHTAGLSPEAITFLRDYAGIVTGSRMGV